MGSRAYLATGVFLRAIEKMLSMNLRVSGAEHLSDRPTLFVVNHFTRFETMIVPYIVHRYIPRPLRSLADHALFRGVFGRYLDSCGVMSVREPLRNRTIIGDLITGRYSWVIYPEGLMMKNKKIVHGRRLPLVGRHRHAVPHTGAAVLALKSEISKRRYLRACAIGDTQESQYYQDRYSLDGPDAVFTDSTVMVPVNITYYPLRPDTNILHRIAKLVRPDLPARIDEELQVEGTILLGDSDMSIHFGPPIQIADHLDKPTEVLRRLAGLVSKPLATEFLLKRQAQRLIGQAMRTIYDSAEINFDHLFCYGLRALKQAAIPVDRLHRVLYLSAVQLRQHGDLRLHPQLEGDLTPMLTGQSFEPLDSIVALAQQDGVLRVEDGYYHVNQSAMTDTHDFHAIRLHNAVQVVANELEPITAAVAVIERYARFDEKTLRRRVPKGVLQADRNAFIRAYDRSCPQGECKPVHVGEPFFLEAPRADVGVVLAHGYLSAPQEIRPLADYLYDRGYSVYGVRLKGHGTAPEALARVDWEEWFRSISRGYAAMRHRCSQVVVGGFSLGGVLAMCLAAAYQQQIAAVFSINAPMKLRDRRTFMVPAVIWWDRLRHSMRIPGAAHSWVSNERTENPGINYEVNYLRGTRQLQLAIAACRKQLDRVTAPALVIQANADPLVHPDSADTIYNELGSSSKYIAKMDYDRHVIVRGDDSDRVFEKIGWFVDRITKRSL